MKKGISVWAFNPAPYAEIFAQAKRAGFDGVELSLGAEGELSLSSTKDDAAKIRRAADEAGISLYSIATGLYWSSSLTSQDKAQRERAKETAKKQLELAAYLGCDTVLVVPGAVSVGFAPELGVTPYEQAYELALEAVRELAPLAESARVSIGLENVWNNFLLSPLEMRQLIDAAGSEWIGSYFDVGNVLATGHPEHWVSVLGKRIKKVHFKDFKKSIGTLDGFCDLLEGDVDYPAVMRALRGIGYDGWVTAEVDPYRLHNEVKLKQTAMAMDKILEEGSKC